MLWIALVAAPTSAWAQPSLTAEAEQARRVTGGITFGANFSDSGGSEAPVIDGMSAQDADIALQTSEKLVVGGFFAIAVNPRWSVRVEALLSIKGPNAAGSINISDFGIDTGSAEIPPLPFNLTHELRYIQVPVLAQWTIPYDNRITPRLYGGPAISVLWGSSLDGEVLIFDSTGRVSSTLDASGDLDDVTNRVDVGVVIGAGVRFPLSRGALTFDARYELGLLSTMDGAFDVNVTGELDFMGVPVQLMEGDAQVQLDASSLRTRGFSLTVGYEF